MIVFVMELMAVLSLAWTGVWATAFDCPGEGYYRDPLACNAYYECQGGASRRLTCPGVLLYRSGATPGEGYCDLPSHVACAETAGAESGEDIPDNDGDDVIESTTYSSVQETQAFFEVESKTGETVLQCPSNFPNGHYPHPYDCRLFLLCVDGLGFSIACPPDMRWSQGHGHCFWRSRVSCRILGQPGNTRDDLDTGLDSPEGSANRNGRAGLVKLDDPGQGVAEEVQESHGSGEEAYDVTEASWTDHLKKEGLELVGSK